MHVTPPRSSKLRVWRLLRPHWKSLTLALLAVLGGAENDRARSLLLLLAVRDLEQLVGVDGRHLGDDDPHTADLGFPNGIRLERVRLCAVLRRTLAFLPNRLELGA